MAKKPTKSKSKPAPKPTKATPAVAAAAGAALFELRTKINALDEALVRILNDRASLVVEVVARTVQ